MRSIFQNLNEYYDRIYVLSLPRLQERIDHIQQALKGLNFEFFWGIDKSHTNIESLEQQGLYNNKRYRQFYKKPEEMSLGMLCCSLGHMHIYEHIVKHKLQRTLILEDDAVPNFESLDLFPKMVKELPNDWELFYLGYEKNERHGNLEMLKKRFYQWMTNHAQLKITKKMYEHFYPVPLTDHISKAGFHDCTHAYSITLAGAEKLLKTQKPVAFNPDNLLSYMVSNEKLKGYIAKPKLFYQLSAFSNKLNSLTA